MTLKEWVRLKMAARRAERPNGHWVKSPPLAVTAGSSDFGVFLKAEDLVAMIDAIDSARTQVRHLACEHTPNDCQPPEEPDATPNGQACDTCKLRWALAEVVEE